MGELSFTTKDQMIIKQFTKVVSTLMLGGVVVFAFKTLSKPVDGSVSGLDPRPMAPGEPVWVAPDWFPDTEGIYGIEQMEQDPIYQKGPRLRSQSALIYDVDAGQVLFEKNADYIRPVASLTKMVSALTCMSLKPDLNAKIVMSLQHKPTRSGAPSRLWMDDEITGWDALGAALVASDNRGPYAIATAAGVDIDPFIEQMNVVSQELKMTLSSWTDPAGIEDDNLSTARDIARATLAMAEHPVLSMVSTSPYWDIQFTNKPTRRVFSTNRMISRRDITFEAAKTGYTDTARYCFSSLVELKDGRRVVVSLLGANGKRSRFADMNRVIDWIEGLPEET